MIKANQDYLIFLIIYPLGIAGLLIDLAVFSNPFLATIALVCIGICLGCLYIIRQDKKRKREADDSSAHGDRDPYLFKKVPRL